MVPRARRLISFLPLFAKYLVSFIFLASVTGKLLSPADFTLFVSSFGFLDFLPARVLLLLSVGVEQALACLLIYPKSSRLGILLSFGALLLFTAVLVVASMTEMKTPCGCFGNLLGESSLDTSILRNIVLLLIVAGASFVPTATHEGR